MDKRLPGRSGEEQPRTSTGKSANSWLLLYIHGKCVLLNPTSVLINSGRFGFQGLGLVISGTMPVFNLTADPGSSQVKAPFRDSSQPGCSFQGSHPSAAHRSNSSPSRRERGTAGVVCCDCANMDYSDER